MTIQQYQKKCSREYLKSIKFPKENTFLYGNPVQTVLPIETAIGKIMVIGPLPAAKVYFVNDIPDVPLPGLPWKEACLQSPWFSIRPEEPPGVGDPACASFATPFHLQTFPKTDQAGPPGDSQNTLPPYQSD